MRMRMDAGKMHTGAREQDGATVQRRHEKERHDGGGGMIVVAVVAGMSAVVQQLETVEGDEMREILAG